MYGRGGRAVNCTSPQLLMATGRALAKALKVYDYCFHAYRRIGNAGLLMDLGCGKGEALARIKGLGYRGRAIGVDIFLPYLRACKALGAHDDLILASVTDLPFRAGVGGTILFLDVLEHLDKGVGSAALKELERMADRVIVLTTTGFVPQRGHEGNPWQAHRSGWSPKEMRELGYRVRGLNGLIYTRTEVGLPRSSGLLGLLALGAYFMLMPLLYLAPRLAFQMLCVKEVNLKGRLARAAEQASFHLLG